MGNIYNIEDFFGSVSFMYKYGDSDSCNVEVVIPLDSLGINLYFFVEKGKKEPKVISELILIQMALEEETFQHVKFILETCPEKILTKEADQLIMNYSFNRRNHENDPLYFLYKKNRVELPLHMVEFIIPNVTLENCKVRDNYFDSHKKHLSIYKVTQTIAKHVMKFIRESDDFFRGCRLEVYKNHYNTRLSNYLKLRGSDFDERDFLEEELEFYTINNASEDNPHPICFYDEKTGFDEKVDGVSIYRLISKSVEKTILFLENKLSKLSENNIREIEKTELKEDHSITPFKNKINDKYFHDDTFKKIFKDQDALSQWEHWYEKLKTHKSFKTNIISAMYQFLLKANNKELKEDKIMCTQEEYKFFVRIYSKNKCSVTKIFADSEVNRYYSDLKENLLLK